MVSSQITFVLTSCGRFDLLEQTLQSFLANNTATIARYIIVEDSGDPAVHSVVAKFKVDMDVLVNDPPIGQLPGIDRAYALVETPYVFHCQDDWRFFRTGFVEQSRLILDRFPELTLINCRKPGQNGVHDKLFRHSPPMEHAGVRFRCARLREDPVWGGYSFNPGLRRLSDYQILGKFAPLGYEVFVSRFFRQLGRGYATLDDPACETTGHGRTTLNRAGQRPKWFGELSALYRQDPRSWIHVSRNEPCRCRSGKKFKHCHGALHSSGQRSGPATASRKP